MKRFIVLILGLFIGVLAHADERIIGGEPAPAGRFLFFATIVKEDGTHLCGATLIKPQWVLTAAHCLEERHAPRFVHTGMERYFPAVIDKDRIEIGRIFSHPQWDFRGQYDIALIRLARPAKDPTYIELDGMRSVANLQVGDPVTLIGFGKTETESRPNQLYIGLGNVLEERLCIEVPPGYPDTNFNPLNNLCAGRNQAGGDSGGPLMIKVGEDYVQVGMVSRTLLDDVGQYTRISFFADWIRTTMQNNP